MRDSMSEAIVRITEVLLENERLGKAPGCIWALPGSVPRGGAPQQEETH